MSLASDFYISNVRMKQKSKTLYPKAESSRALSAYHRSAKSRQEPRELTSGAVSVAGVQPQLQPAQTPAKSMYERGSSQNYVKVVRTQPTSGAGLRSVISGGSRPPALIIENRSKILSYGSRGKQYTSEISGSHIDNEN
jgi:hypothetical protein